MAEPRRVRVIGIGTGHPDQLSAEAVAALRSVDYVLAASKRPDDPLLVVRRALCDRYDVPLVAVSDPVRDRDDPADYPGAVRDWHEARVAAYEALLLERPGDVAFLVWGDPAFYDSTLRIVERIRERGRVALSLDVLPGVSSPQLLAARHRIVLHRVGEPVVLTTGRRLRRSIEAGHDNLVVMLDGRLACLDPATDASAWQIWWGANLGTDEERLVSGRLDEVADELRAQRTEAERAAGWVMDTYLLRRVTAGPVPSKP
ncbi:MAG TPA: precorrin-6A synthase (deacetylating) [Marmoricola sp.]|nr:precorrin-6A synthase (deacetylating) [Marmoricola sp.]